jgi:hypothetical protein
MVDEQTRRDALAWINSMIADDEVQDWEDAAVFVVLTTNAETESIHLNGPFTDVIAALAWAGAHETDLNKDLTPDEDPFTVRVYPVTPVDTNDA